MFAKDTVIRVFYYEPSISIEYRFSSDGNDVYRRISDEDHVFPLQFEKAKIKDVSQELKRFGYLNE